MHIEWLTLDPFHFQDGVPLAVYSDPFRLKREIDFVRRMAPLQVTTEGFIAVLVILKLTQKASDGPFSPVTKQWIDTGKSSGDWPWKPESIKGRPAALELRIREIRLGILDDFLIV